MVPGRRTDRGFRVKKSGKRVNQLGTTFVVGPGSQVRYAHVDAHTADHAPLADVLRRAPAVKEVSEDVIRSRLWT